MEIIYDKYSSSLFFEDNGPSSAKSFPVQLISLSFAHKKQYSFHLSFNSILQLINGISSDLQKLLKYLNGTEIFAFFRIPLA